MKKDGEIKLLLNERGKGASQKLAAARAGVSERTARKYEQAGKLPSQLKKVRTHRTRDNPFVDDWPWVEAQIADDPALQTKTLFGLLCAAFPGRYQEGQLRTLQRHVQAWRVRHGPGQEIMFPQQHQPGRMAQSDFTSMNALGVNIAGTSFPHLVYHFVLTYSNVEAVRVCFSESFEALAEGLESCVWQIGGVPEWHRTDNLFDIPGPTRSMGSCCAGTGTNSWRVEIDALRAWCARGRRGPPRTALYSPRGSPT